MRRPQLRIDLSVSCWSREGEINHHPIASSQEERIITITRVLGATLRSDPMTYTDLIQLNNENTVARH